jgi:hypothetical protein
VATAFVIAECGGIVASGIPLQPVVQTAPAYAQTASNLGNGLAPGDFHHRKSPAIQPGCASRLQLVLELATLSGIQEHSTHASPLRAA